jgi:hypothetical protein
MNYKKLLFVCGIMAGAIGFVINCNNSSSPTAPVTNGLVGVWTGALSNRGGGGAIMTHGRDSVDASGNPVLNDIGDTIRLGFSTRPMPPATLYGNMIQWVSF